MSTNDKHLEIGFIGAGKIARALGGALWRHGYQVSAVSSRNYKSALSVASQIPGCKAVKTANEVSQSSNIVFITTPDIAIGQVCSDTNWKPRQMVIHTSGADSRSVLESAHAKGALTGVFHPLATIASEGNAPEPFEGITITLEAKPPLLEILEGIAHSLGANTLELHEKNRALYHASAVFVSNYVMALTDIAEELWQEMGFEKSLAEKALLPLLKGAVHNLQIAGLPDCLTGPVSRGDTGTVKKHLDSLEKLEGPINEIYRQLGRYTAGIAVKKGSLTSQQFEVITSILNAKENEHDQIFFEK